MDQNQAQARGKVGLFSLSSDFWVVTKMGIGLFLVEFKAGGSDGAAEGVSNGEG